MVRLSDPNNAHCSLEFSFFFLQNNWLPSGWIMIEKSILCNQ
jgi:hypothetical protein